MWTTKFSSEFGSHHFFFSKNIAPLFSVNIQFWEKDSIADIIADNAWHIPIQLPTELQEFYVLFKKPESIEN